MRKNASTNPDETTFPTLKIESIDRNNQNRKIPDAAIGLPCPPDWGLSSSTFLAFNSPLLSTIQPLISNVHPSFNNNYYELLNAYLNHVIPNKKLI